QRMTLRFLSGVLLALPAVLRLAGSASLLFLAVLFSSAGPFASAALHRLIVFSCPTKLPVRSLPFRRPPFPWRADTRRTAGWCGEGELLVGSSSTRRTEGLRRPADSSP